MRRWILGIALTTLYIAGCGGGGGGTTPPVTTQTAATPTISTTAAQNGALVVTLATTTSGTNIYYTVDGTTPTASAQIYQAPFLVASNLTIKAIATGSGFSPSSVASQVFSPNIPSGTLVWSDEFTNSTSANAQPNPLVWTYDTGASGWGNSELENYCAWNSSVSPCDPTNPNAFVATDGYLHIVATKTASGGYNSARLKTEGLFSFQYGRIEASMKVPEETGLWPAFWLLGTNINTDPWPACGELDVMEHIDGSNPANEGFDWVQGSIHGTGLNGGTQYHPAGFSATDWHTYGMIWTKGQIEYYIDNPTNIYATFDSASAGGVWPFDSGPQFIIMNLAVGGNWPGPPDGTTAFPAQIQVDYVRIYAN